MIGRRIECSGGIAEPSILTRGHDGEWHGYLERGVWRSC